MGTRFGLLISWGTLCQPVGLGSQFGVKYIRPNFKKPTWWAHFSIFNYKKFMVKKNDKE